MYVILLICSEVRFVKISSPNECDKILKIPNEQTEVDGLYGKLTIVVRMMNYSYVMRNDK